MHAVTTVIFSIAAALAAAQSTNSTLGPNAFNIPAGQSSYVVTAGKTVDLSWTNQQGSTVTIKLQVPGISTPESGLTLADSIPNTGATTVTIPDGSEIPPGAYTFEIINDEDPSDPNFSPSFSVASASGTGTFGATATSSGSSASASASSSASASASTTTGSASTTSSSASASASASRTSSASSTRSSAATSSEAAATTSAPNSNAGAKAQAPLAAAMILGAAAFL